MASNAGAPNPALAAAPAVSAGHYPCPECSRMWGSARACSGHMAVHSREANRSRRNAPMSDRDSDMLRMLVPNPNFWKEYRSGGRRPATIMFAELLWTRARHRPVVENGDNVPRRSRNAAPATVANRAEDGGSSMGSFLSLNVNSNI